MIVIPYALEKWKTVERKSEYRRDVIFMAFNSTGH